MIMLTLGFFGLIFGSFVNAFVWRLHEQELLLGKKRKPSKKQMSDLSIMKGRSMCPNCKHELAGKDLVPVFSWLYLRGKCRYCQVPISWQYPLVEVVTAVLFTLSYAYWPDELQSIISIAVFAIWLLFIVMFMALTVYDLRWFLLPDRVVYPLILVAVVYTLLRAADAGSLRVILDAGLGALVLFGTFWVLFQVSGGKWIGGGDVKLAIVLGALAGTPLKALLILFFSSVIGTICSTPILLRGKKAMKVQVPYGPFLLAATVVVVLFGTTIIDWYTRQLVG